jgi:hypothetical protein
MVFVLTTKHKPFLCSVVPVKDCFTLVTHKVKILCTCISDLFTGNGTGNGELTNNYSKSYSYSNSPYVSTVYMLHLPKQITMMRTVPTVNLTIPISIVCNTDEMRRRGSNQNKSPSF